MTRRSASRRVIMPQRRDEIGIAPYRRRISNCTGVHCTKTHTHAHTHPFNGPLSGTTRVSRYQNGKTSLDFTEARDSERQWHQLGHMQVCTSLQTDNHASTPPLSFLQAGCPSCRPNNSVRALKAETKTKTCATTRTTAEKSSLVIFYSLKTVVKRNCVQSHAFAFLPCDTMPLFL